MTDALQFVPPRVPLVDPRTGMVTREWYLFLQGVFTRIGGANGPGNEDLAGSMFEDAGSSETVAMLFSLDQALGQTPQPSEAVAPYDLQSEISELRATVAELQRTLDSVCQGTLI